MNSLPLKRLAGPLLLAALLMSTANTQASDGPVARIISADANSTSLLLALGLGQQLVAVDVTSTLPPDYPPLPDIGYHRALSAEGLLSLAPTLLVGSDRMGPSASLSALERADVAVVRLPAPLSIETLKDNIRHLSQVLQREAAGARLQQDLDELTRAVSDDALSQERVAFLLTRPGHGMQLAGEGTAGAALIATLGAANVATFERYRTVSAEALMSLQPSVILVAGDSARDSVQALLADHPVLHHSKAVRAARIHAVDGSTLVAGLSLAAIEEAARLRRLLLVEAAREPLPDSGLSGIARADEGVIGERQ